ncbi:hypothetical protein M427DRAFT_28455 [Gonapodya prolifera JEL478]|uniref:Polysaccharide pyruvyl transferase domain-containing protein n=1 Tax=Gonapodya prolifera (strain JEL478) TaxID=1344416 RepID=A0A139AUA8_GONPJ|nr:hypothetical protein M427DRAFT_28455 [Gonapodya prolifera JEL478]|eukprot:KXS20153.1 hypothetical protein M427DRAFT_28455 [Gonapodya prolifera JEL478]
MPKQLFHFDFKLPNKLESIPYPNTMYDAIVIGGGDVVIPYFFDQIYVFHKRAPRLPIYAFSVGVPFEEQTHLLDLCNMVHARNISDQDAVSARIGPSNTIRYLDIAFLLRQAMQVWRRLPLLSPRRRVGLFLSRPIASGDMSYYSHVVKQLAQLVENIYRRNPNTDFVFVPLDTNINDPTNCDYKINVDVLRILQENVNIFHNMTFLTAADTVPDANEGIANYPDKMCQIYSTLDFAICMRFHSTVLSIVTSTPFMTLHTTRKVSQLLQDTGFADRGYALPLDPVTLAPVDLDVDRAMSMYAALSAVDRDSFNAQCANLSANKAPVANAYISALTKVLTDLPKRRQGAGYVSSAE